MNDHHGLPETIQDHDLDRRTLVQWPVIVLDGGVNCDVNVDELGNLVDTETDNELWEITSDCPTGVSPNLTSLMSGLQVGWR